MSYSHSTKAEAIFYRFHRWRTLGWSNFQCTSCLNSAALFARETSEQKDSFKEDQVDLQGTGIRDVDSDRLGNGKTAVGSLSPDILSKCTSVTVVRS
jgi:hypothetical protein